MAQGRRPTTAQPALASQQQPSEVKAAKNGHAKHSSLPLNNAAKQQQHHPHQDHHQDHHQHQEQQEQGLSEQKQNVQSHHQHHNQNQDFYLLKNNGIGNNTFDGVTSIAGGDRYDAVKERPARHRRREQAHTDDYHQQQHPLRLSPLPKDPFRDISTDLIYRQNPEWTREKDKIVSAPYEYLLVHPGKDIRSRSIVAFNAFLKVPEESLRVIKRVVGMLHTASLLWVISSCLHAVNYRHHIILSTHILNQ